MPREEPDSNSPPLVMHWKRSSMAASPVTRPTSCPWWISPPLYEPVMAPV
ncbi:MAG TPA: hypothetical protein VFH27_04430 [Longimicrobiaceae bacterium]|nr:hypothetical protein [Longimicrobiaceae bacterium]